jgi:hypothetical protein
MSQEASNSVLFLQNFHQVNMDFIFIQMEIYGVKDVWEPVLIFIKAHRAHMEALQDQRVRDILVI